MAPRPQHQAGGRSRHRARRGGSRSVAVAVVMCVAGLMFSTSATAARHTQSGTLRQEQTDMQQQLLRARAAQRNLTEQNADLADTYRDLQSSAAAADTQAQTAADAAAAAADLAGVSELTGDAVVVSLDDAPESALDKGASAEDIVVHQQDVQSVINALWAGGARGVQLMDQRLVSTSGVRCVGNTLILQGQVYSPPYVITAVGDTARLRAALDDDSAVTVYRDYADLFGLGFTVRTRTGVTLPAYTAPTLKYATPATSSAGSTTR